MKRQGRGPPGDGGREAQEESSAGSGTENVFCVEKDFNAIDSDQSIKDSPKSSESSSKFRKNFSKKNSETASSKKVLLKPGASSSVTDKKENSGVVIGNFHACDKDDQSEVLLPRIVNGCSRVILPTSEHQIKRMTYCSQFAIGTVQPRVMPHEQHCRGTRCRMGSSGGCCQPLANRKTFLAIYCLTTVLQGMFYTYFASVLSTIQKLYRTNSQVTGFVMSATELGQIGGALFLSYYGGNGHRPRWIGWGVLLFAACTLMCALPHFIFDYPESLQLSVDSTYSLKAMDDFNTCSKPDTRLVESATNDTAFRADKCQDASEYTVLVLGILFIALIGIGIGQTAVANLGIPYIDDNVDSSDSAMYFGK